MEQIRRLRRRHPNEHVTQFKSPGRPSRAPDTNSGGYRPSRVIRGLRPTSHVAIGTDPMTPASYVRPPGRHSFRALRRSASARFRGTERRSVPLPADAGFSRFGAVSRWTHWQALSIKPFVVELFIVALLISRDRRAGQARYRSSPSDNSPRQPRYANPALARNRPSSHGRDLRSHGPRTRFEPRRPRLV